MKILMTTNAEGTTCTLYDSESKDIKHIPFESGQENKNCDVSRPAHRPFGITWDANNIYIASRKSLLVYDSEFKWVDKIELLDENTHQIAYINGEIAVCMTRKDCIAFVNPLTRERRMFHPDKGWGNDFPTLAYPGDLYEDGYERYHINGITPVDDKVFFLVNRPCYIVELNLKTEKIDSLTPASDREMTNKLFHNLFIDGDRKKTIKSNGAILENEKRDLSIADIADKITPRCKFYRGATGTYDNPLISYSSFRGRGLAAGLSNGDVFNFNAITDIRRIDGQDDAHHNPHPFPYAWE